jgi:hypothetical protein
MAQSVSYSAGEENSHPLQNLKVHYHIHQNFVMELIPCVFHNMPTAHGAMFLDPNPKPLLKYTPYFTAATHNMQWPLSLYWHGSDCTLSSNIM